MCILEILSKRIKPATCELLESFAIEFSDSKINLNLAYRHHVLIGGLINSLIRELGRNKISRFPLKTFIKEDKKKSSFQIFPEILMNLNS